MTTSASESVGVGSGSKKSKKKNGIWESHDFFPLLFYFGSSTTLGWACQCPVTNENLEITKC